MKVRKKRFGWLVGLALWPVVGWGQKIIRDPENATVCVGGVARFTSESAGGLMGWLIDNVIIANLPDEKGNLLEIDHITTPNGTTIQTLKFTKYDELFDDAEVVSFLLPDNTESNPAYLFYETNHQSPATGLIATANDTAIQVNWNASKVRTQYLVSITNVTETPAVVSSPHYTYLPESQDCQWYEFLVTTHECFNSTNLDTSQNTAASVRVAYPNISPVTAQFDNNDSKTVLLNWVSAGNSTNYWVSITDLDRGNQTQVAYRGDPPFSYTPALCGQFNLNVSVSPAECADEPGFTHSDTIRFSIPCPATATGATVTEIPNQPSGTQASYPSLLLTIAAVIPLLRWWH